MSDKAEYRWPSLKAVVRKYIVRDDKGRIGIAYDGSAGNLWAYPIEYGANAAPGQVKGAETLPPNAIVMTQTLWHGKGDGTYTGWWVDDDVPTFPAKILPDMIRSITIWHDMGYYMPDDMAELFLAGSDQIGHWDSYWAAIAGKKGGASTSARKSAASRSNGRKGGRPKKKSE